MNIHRTIHRIAQTQQIIALHLANKSIVKNATHYAVVSIADDKITLNPKMFKVTKDKVTLLDHEIMHIQLDHHIRFLLLMSDYLRRYGMKRYAARKASAQELADEAFVIFCVAADIEVDHRMHSPPSLTDAVRKAGLHSYKVEDVFWWLARKIHLQLLRKIKTTADLKDVLRILNQNEVETKTKK